MAEYAVLKRAAERLVELGRQRGWPFRNVGTIAADPFLAMLIGRAFGAGHSESSGIDAAVSVYAKWMDMKEATE